MDQPEIALDEVEARIAGCLIEKQLTTPQQYPLTLNALCLACNQTSNRDPVVAWDEPTVEAGVASLKQKGLARFVLPSHGRSVVRYRHVLDERLALDEKQLSLVGVLLLRGPQTAGELRTRTERMAPFTGITEIESDLEGLTRRQPPLVERMERRAGQKEERWRQMFTPAPPDQPYAAQARAGGMSLGDLRAEVSELRETVEQLRAEVEALRRELGG